MADRRVRGTRKDDDGDITRLCNSGAAWLWETKATAIRHINSNEHSYYVDEAGYRSEIHVAGTPPSEYLRTYADPTSKNNLDNLPDC